MKSRTSIFVSILLFFITGAYSQILDCKTSCKKDIETIHIKMGSDEYPIIPKVSPRGAFNIKISGFNPLLYKYEIAIDDSITTINSKPALFDVLGISNLSTIAANIKSKVSGKMPVFPGKGKFKNFMFDLNISDDFSCCDLSQINFINTHFEGLGDSIQVLLESPCSKTDSIALFTLYTVLGLSTQNLDSLKKLSTETKLVFYDFQIASRKSSYDSSLSDIDLDYDSFKSSIDKIKKQYDRIIGMLINLDYGNSKVKEIQSFSNHLQKMNKENKNLGIALDTTLSFDNYVDIVAAFQMYKDLKTYTSLPYFMDGNAKNVKVSISPFSKDSNIQPYNTSFLVKPKQTFSFGFSSGFFGTSLVDQNYSDTVSIDSTFGIIQEEQNKYSVGVQAMAHTYLHITDNISGHIGIGPTLTYSSKIRPGLIFGGGLAFGEKNKLVLSFGYHVGYVQRLSNSYRLDRLYDTASTSYTVDRLNGDYFISIGYNFLTF